jgi:hypothetical protein
MAFFQFSGLPATEFAGLFSKSDQALSVMGIRRMTVTSKPGFPCRVSLDDAEIGEEVLLLPYIHHDVDSPYRASGPIFVRKDTPGAQLAPNEIPAVLLHRLLSLRCYDNAGMMLEAHVLEGKELSQMLSQLFDNQKIEYMHVHNAKPGCYSCSVRRVH